MENLIKYANLILFWVYNWLKLNKTMRNPTLKDFKKLTQKIKIIIFWTQNIFSLLLQVKSAGNDPLPLSIPRTSIFIDNGHHQLRIRDLLL